MPQPVHADQLIRRRSPRGRVRKGLTLFESLIAIGLLAATVTAVMSALASGRQHSEATRQHLSASLAAEMLMARVTATAHTNEGWDSLPQWQGYTEAPGNIQAGSGSDLPHAYQQIGLSVDLATVHHEIPKLAVRIDGRDIRVRAHDQQGQPLAEIVRFVPEPQAP